VAGVSGNAGLVQNSFAIEGVVIVNAVDQEIVVRSAVAVGGDGKESPSGSALDAGLECDQVLEVAPL
jgi:hypothetical protein